MVRTNRSTLLFPRWSWIGHSTCVIKWFVQNYLNFSPRNIVAVSVRILFGMTFWAIYSLRNSITFSVVGLLANDALGHPVLWSIATSKYFSFLGAILNGPAKSRASSSLNASAAASLPKFDCDFIGFKFLPESLHWLHVCASRTISRCICGHQLSATACNIASRPG